MLKDDVRYILRSLIENGYEAYVVGGAVRNFILNKEIHDYDITTSALPEEVEKLFIETVPTGIRYGTITVFIHNTGYEVTTFRSDGEYLDYRRPEKVEFSKNLKEDLKRRDFTINALCVDYNDNIIDLVNGVDDIKNKIIRCIGNPDERFKEDALRMLRAIRFMCMLNFKIEECTMSSIKENSSLIKNVSIERIQDEFNKILLSEKPSDGIKAMINTGLIDYVLPEIKKCIGFEQHNPYHDKDVFEHIMAVLDNIEPQLNLRLAALMHDISKPECYTMDENGIGHFSGHHIKSADTALEIMKRLRYSNDLINDVFTLIRYHNLKEIDMKDKGVKRFINSVGLSRLDDMFRLNTADIKGKRNTTNFERVEVLREKCHAVIDKKEPMSLKELVINGNDLYELGIPKGKIYSEILNGMLDYVLEFPEKNNKSDLIDFIKNSINQNKQLN